MPSGAWCIAQGAQLVLCGDLEEWGGGGGKREPQEGRDTCTHIAGSHCRTIKPTQHCQAIIVQF